MYDVIRKLNFQKHKILDSAEVIELLLGNSLLRYYSIVWQIIEPSSKDILFKISFHA